MRTLPRPSTTARDAFTLSISTVRTGDLRTRLMSIEDDITDAASLYERCAAVGELHKYPLERGVGPVTTKELMTNYDQRFAAKGSPGRPVYDSIILGPSESRCPLCGHRTVSSLDHHLPKSLHPGLAVAPLNLIPSCSDCNKAKRDRKLLKRSDQTLHPYFDDVDTHTWLTASIVEARPAGIIYAAVPHSSWASSLQERLARHFDVFSLADSYAAQAATELAEVSLHNHELHKAGGPTLLRAHLLQMHQSCGAVQLNSWRTALYQALAASPWYVNGGAF